MVVLRAKVSMRRSRSPPHRCCSRRGCRFRALPLRSHPPDKEDGIKVVFYFEESGTYNIASKGLWVHYHAVLERELKKLLGENNVVYKP